MGNLNVVKLAGIALLVALAITLGVGAKAVQAQTLFGLAHSGPDGLSTLYRINPATGGFDPVGSDTGFQRCSGMDFDALGTLFATCERNNPDPEPDTHVLITIDPSTGEGKGAEVGPTGVGLEPPILSLFKTVSDISFRNSYDVLYAYLVKFNFLGTIDVASGEATAIMPPGGIGNFGVGNGIAFSPEDELFHADDIELNTLDLATGVATPVDYLVFPGPPSPPGLGCCDNIPRVNAMDFQPGTGILFASVNDRLLQSPGGGERPHRNFLATINTTTGDVTIIGNTVKGLDAIAFAPAAAAPPAKAELGGFKCYKVKRAKGESKLDKIEVTLSDRFDGPNETQVEKAESVCTPVPDVPDSTAGFTCYKIKYEEEHEKKHEDGQPKFQQLDVVVGNELFGEGQALTLKKPKVICVPSKIVVP